MNWDLWLAVGLIGQTAFFLRFLVQWLVSEKKGESTIPVAFWYFSLAGGLILFFYAVHKKDPVFIIGQSSGLLVYVRNLFLIRRSSSAKQLNELQAVQE
jgi:lipid-A-disaccharide synthase-like uncharacterized protein